MPPISCTKSNTRSAHEDSTLSKTVFFMGGGDQVFASQIKTKEEIFLGDTNPLKGQLICLPSLVQSQTPDQHIKTVHCPKQFYPLF